MAVGHRYEVAWMTVARLAVGCGIAHPLAHPCVDYLNFLHSIPKFFENKKKIGELK